MMTQEQEYLTVSEAAQRFGIKEANIREWIKRGLINSYKTDLPVQRKKRIQVDAAEIERKRTPRLHTTANEDL